MESGNLSLPFSAPKAGMAEEASSKLAQVIQDEASKNSAYFIRKQEMKDRNVQRVQEYKQEIQKIMELPEKRKALFREFADKMEEIEKLWFLEAHWIHVDLDMFFVAVEIRDQPELANRPVAVGSTIVSTSNYIARTFGIRSAMPMHMAKQLCPGLVIIKGNGSKYKEASDIFMDIIADYDSNYESGGLDEAKLEVSDYFTQKGIEPTQEAIQNLMTEIRNRVKEEIKITCSCGYAANSLLAKICSDIKKPDGQFYLPKTKESISEFIENLDVRKIPGIGPQTEDILKGLGIEKVSQLKLRLFDIFIVFGEKKMFSDLAMKSMGIGRTIHKEKTERKSFNISKTIPPTQSKSLLLNYLESMCQTLAQKLIEKKRLCKNVRVKLKFQDFKEYDKSVTLAIHTDKQEHIHEQATLLFAKLSIYMDVRLIGVSVSDLSDEESHIHPVIINIS